MSNEKLTLDTRNKYSVQNHVKYFGRAEAEINGAAGEQVFSQGTDGHHQRTAAGGVSCRYPDNRHVDGQRA